MHLQQTKSIAKNRLLIDIETDTAVAELLRDVDKVTRTTSKIENVAPRTALKREILRPFDVAFDPKFGVAETMHFFNFAWILLSQGVPRLVLFKLDMHFSRINRMESTMHVLASARDNVGVEEFK